MTVDTDIMLHTLDHEGNSSNSHLYKGGAIITGRLQLSTSTDALHADNTDNMLYIDSRQYTYTAEAWSRMFVTLAQSSEILPCVEAERVT